MQHQFIFLFFFFNFQKIDPNRRAAVALEAGFCQFKLLGDLKLSSRNYCPVSLTSFICMLLETLVKEIMLEHLLNNNFILGCQHGFLLGKLCLTNLLETMEKIRKALAQSFSVDLVYTYLAKSFERVSNDKLLYKLSLYGYSESLSLSYDKMDHIICYLHL